MNCRNRVMNCETIDALSKTKHSVLVYFQISPHICVLCVPAAFRSLSLSLDVLCVPAVFLSLSLSLSLPLSLLSLDVFVCLISPRSFCIHKCPRKIVLALCAACVLRLQVVV